MLERRWDSRRRSASVAHDFRRLAALFASAPGDAEAHRLFAAGFGLWSARHAHLLPGDGEARCPTASWSATEPVEVAPSLRTTGDLMNRGRSRPVSDPSGWRAQRLAAQAAALSDFGTLRASLTTVGTVRLSAFGRLPTAGFAELLTLLAAGLDAPCSAAGTRRALSADGRVEVTLRDPEDGRRAVLVAPEGMLRGPDLVVSITLTATAAGAVAAGEASLPPERKEASGG